VALCEDHNQEHPPWKDCLHALGCTHNEFVGSASLTRSVCVPPRRRVHPSRFSLCSTTEAVGESFDRKAIQNDRKQPGLLSGSETVAALPARAGVAADRSSQSAIEVRDPSPAMASGTTTSQSLVSDSVLLMWCYRPGQRPHQHKRPSFASISMFDGSNVEDQIRCDWVRSSLALIAKLDCRSIMLIFEEPPFTSAQITRTSTSKYWLFRTDMRHCGMVGQKASVSGHRLKKS
jgi:hypothetical protein